MAMHHRQRHALRVTATLSTGLALVVGGATLAVATTGAATTTVNIRSGPGTSHHITGSLVRGQRITVTGKAKHGWVKVSLGGSRAYVAAKYLDTKGHLPALPKKISTSGTKVATESLNVRSGPSSSSRIVGHLPEGRRVSLTGAQRGGFAQTEFGGHRRWVSVAYLAKAHSGVGTTGSTDSSSNKSSSSKKSTKKSTSTKNKSTKKSTSIKKKSTKKSTSTKRKSSSTAHLSSAAKGRKAVAFVKRQLGKPYVWGAEGPNSYDCSGLVQAAWKSVGVQLPRVARWQYAQGHHIAKSQLRPGDLVFYYTQHPRHVGMYVGNGRIIDAPRTGMNVRYTTLNHMPYSGAVRPGRA